MRDVEQSSNMGLNATDPGLKNFAMSVSPHRRIYYSVFTTDNDVTVGELGYHPPFETRNFRLGFSAGGAKPQGQRGIPSKYLAGGFKLETGWGPSLHYMRTHGENLFFVAYRFSCIDKGKW
ncbi:MAG: hypothetical protein HYT38_02050 [Candidatus Sungbacteria bacterium]|nr:hypothetical protein [Candidatus Sungbacteria bacterium]